MINKGILRIQCAFTCFFASDGAENPTGFVVVFIFLKQLQQQHCIIILSPSDCKLSVCQRNYCCKWLKLFAESTSSSALGTLQQTDNRLAGNNYRHCFLSTGYTVLRLISNPDILVSLIHSYAYKIQVVIFLFLVALCFRQGYAM